MGDQSRIRELRLHKCWSLQHLAERVGVSINTLNRWELGKQRPYGQNLLRLSQALGVSPEELGEVAPSNASPLSLPSAPLIAAFLAGDLSMRLLTLASTPHRNFAEVQEKVSFILEEFDAMNTENTDPMTRREALRRLATVSLVPLLSPTSFRQSSEVTLTQSAASIAACWELSRGKHGGDLELAFEGVSAYLGSLKPLIEASSQHRKAAAELATQCALLQTVLGWHLKGVKAAAEYGQNAVYYSQVSDNIVLQLESLKCLTFAYYYDPYRVKEALQTIDQAVALLKRQGTRVPWYMQSKVHSVRALLQAKNGQPYKEALKQAEKMSYVDSGYAAYIDRPLPVLTLNEAITHYHIQDYGTAWGLMAQIIDPEQLITKQPLPERTYVEALNTQVFISLKRPKKDMEQTMMLWKAGIQSAISLQSRLHFNESLLAYEMMQAVWSGEKRIQELQASIIHW